MSGGYFEYTDITASSTIFNNDRPVNVFEDREISELVWDMFDLIHKFDWYKSGDTDKESYIEAKTSFKKKWFGKRPEMVKRIIDDAISDVRQELYETYGVHGE